MALTVTLDLPDAIVRELKNTAIMQHRSIAEVLQDLILQNWRPLPKLPDYIETELAAMSGLSDQALWTLARSTIALEDQEQFALLNQEAKLGVLSDQEEKKLEVLLNQYDENMIRRAQAVSLLGKRGYDMSDPTVLRPQ